MPLFGKSHKSPADIVRTLKENLTVLVKHDKKTEKVGTYTYVAFLLIEKCPFIPLVLYVVQASEEVSKCLVSMKEILYGSNDKEPHTETVAQLAQELYNSGLLISLVENLQVIDFEVRGYQANDSDDEVERSECNVSGVFRGRKMFARSLTTS